MKTTQKILTVIVFASFVLLAPVTHAQDISKEQVVGEWKFAAITMISPKTGYVPSLSEKTVRTMSFCMANYNFNEDGSLGFSEDYRKKNELVSAGWALDGQTLNITYNFIDGAEGHTNSAETYPWEIVSVADDTMVMSLMGLFKVQLEK